MRGLGGLLGLLRNLWLGLRGLEQSSGRKRSLRRRRGNWNGGLLGLRGCRSDGRSHGLGRWRSRLLLSRRVVSMQEY